MEKTALKNFLDERGRLTAFPAKRKTKIYALCYLAEKFERDKKYTEKEVNEVLKAWHTFDDPATLRRELYDYKFLDRWTSSKNTASCPNRSSRKRISPTTQTAL